MNLADHIKALILELGVSATFYSKTVRVIFNNQYVATQLFGMGLENKNPFVIGLESDFTSAKIGDTITINSTNYKIASIQPNNVGAVHIELTRA